MATETRISDGNFPDQGRFGRFFRRRQPQNTATETSPPSNPSPQTTSQPQEVQQRLNPNLKGFITNAIDGINQILAQQNPQGILSVLYGDGQGQVYGIVSALQRVYTEMRSDDMAKQYLQPLNGLINKVQQNVNGLKGAKSDNQRLFMINMSIKPNLEKIRSLLQNILRSHP